MMKYGLALITALLLTATGHAEDFDVDDADSLDFERFHQSKAPAQTALQPKPAKQPATVELAPGYHATKTNADRTTQISAVSGTMKPHQRFTLSEYYRVTGATPGVVDAISSLHRQVALRCPAGWEKISEYSTSGDQGYYLVFLLSCL